MPCRLQVWWSIELLALLKEPKQLLVRHLWLLLLLRRQNWRLVHPRLQVCLSLLLLLRLGPPRLCRKASAASAVVDATRVGRPLLVAREGMLVRSMMLCVRWCSAPARARRVNPPWLLREALLRMIPHGPTPGRLLVWVCRRPQRRLRAGRLRQRVHPPGSMGCMADWVRRCSGMATTVVSSQRCQTHRRREYQRRSLHDSNTASKYRA